MRSKRYNKYERINEARKEKGKNMEKGYCVNAAAVVSFFVGALAGLGAALLIAPQSGEIKERLKRAAGRKVKLSREQIIEEGVQCAVPEGADICYPE